MAGSSEGGGGINPMHQFEVHSIVPIKLGSIDASFTNASLWMVIVVASVCLLLLLSSSKLVPSRLQSVGELAYEFVANMMRDILGDSGRAFFPLVFTLFMFVLASNMWGMINIPVLLHPFTVTSHIIVTFAMAMFVFILATIVGFVKHGAGYLKLFVPSGVPAVLLPLLVVIETISYFTRPISLSVRLFANMMAGHTMLKVFAGFVVGMGVLGGWAPLALMVAFTGLEILVAFLQAYVFAVLTCIYLNDAINMHH
ncbi:MAG: F0F1 ATP synthase subunit A [Alphaproteobacteria bacterium]|nr:F0F1 ATP synthase subunit A [Alphaproteobacteria bacterium]